MEYLEFKKNIEERIFNLEMRDKAIFGKELDAQEIISSIDELMLRQQLLYEESLELLPDIDKLVLFVERRYKEEQLKTYDEIIKDNSINKSNRLTVLDLKTSDIKSIYDEAKSLKSRIQILSDKEKERLWTLRALKKSVI